MKRVIIDCLKRRDFESQALMDALYSVGMPGERLKVRSRNGATVITGTILWVAGEGKGCRVSVRGDGKGDNWKGRIVRLKHIIELFGVEI